MDRTRTREGAEHADHRALERFVRSLVGVRDAAVTLRDDGRADIRIVAQPGVPERQIRLNVVSALMAGPGLAVEDGALRFVASLQAPAPAEAASRTNGSRAHTPEAAPVAEALPVPSPSSNGTAPQPPAPSPGGSLRVVRFDVEHPMPGRIRVIVGVAGEARSGLGVREGDDRPGAALELAARAAADAVRAAGCAGTAFQLAGVALSEVAGRTHVVAAVDVWTGRDFAACPGAAAVLASYEEAAARAVVAALSRY